MNFETVLIYGIIILVVILIAIVYNGIESYNKKNKSKMSFMESMNLTGLPIITIENGNKKYNFMLDTGATASILDVNSAEGFLCVPIERSNTIDGVGGSLDSNCSVAANLTYKNITLQESFYVIDMSSTFGKLKEETGVTVNGLLGSSFLERNKYVLDFKDLIAYLK